MASDQDLLRINQQQCSHHKGVNRLGSLQMEYPPGFWIGKGARARNTRFVLASSRPALLLSLFFFFFHFNFLPLPRPFCPVCSGRPALQLTRSYLTARSCLPP